MVSLQSFSLALITLSIEVFRSNGIYSNESSGLLITFLRLSLAITFPRVLCIAASANCYTLLYEFPTPLPPSLFFPLRLGNRFDGSTLSRLFRLLSIFMVVLLSSVSWYSPGLWRGCTRSLIQRWFVVFFFLLGRWTGESLMGILAKGLNGSSS